jgi:hypothetical protein
VTGACGGAGACAILRCERCILRQGVGITGVGVTVYTCHSVLVGVVTGILVGRSAGLLLPGGNGVAYGRQHAGVDYSSVWWRDGNWCIYLFWVGACSVLNICPIPLVSLLSMPFAVYYLYSFQYSFWLPYTNASCYSRHSYHIRQ